MSDLIEIQAGGAAAAGEECARFTLAEIAEHIRSLPVSRLGHCEKKKPPARPPVVGPVTLGFVAALLEFLDSQALVPHHVKVLGLDVVSTLYAQQRL